MGVYGFFDEESRVGCRLQWAPQRRLPHKKLGPGPGLLTRATTRSRCGQAGAAGARAWKVRREAHARDCDYACCAWRALAPSAAICLAHLSRCWGLGLAEGVFLRLCVSALASIDSKQNIPSNLLSVVLKISGAVAPYDAHSRPAAAGSITDRPINAVIRVVLEPEQRGNAIICHCHCYCRVRCLRQLPNESDVYTINITKTARE